jgi:hypothetical protein
MRFGTLMPQRKREERTRRKKSWRAKDGRFELRFCHGMGGVLGTNGQTGVRTVASCQPTIPPLVEQHEVLPTRDCLNGIAYTELSIRNCLLEGHSVWKGIERHPGPYFMGGPVQCLVRYCWDLPYPSTLRGAGGKPPASRTAARGLPPIVFSSKDPPGLPMKCGHEFLRISS